MFKKSIIIKFMSLYLVVGLSSISVIGIYSYYKARNALLMRATEQLNSVKSLKREQIESFLNATNKSVGEGDINVNIDFGELNKIMLDTVRTNGLGKSGEVYLVDSDYIMKSLSRFFSDRTSPLRVETLPVRTAFEKGSGNMIAKDYRGILCLSSFDRISAKGLNWAIIAEIDYNEAMIPIKSLRNDLIFVSAIILILILSIAQVITSDIIMPIIKFKNAALKIGEGNFDVKVDINSENEFGVLAVTFNRMIENIEKKTSELVEERSKRVSALYDGQEFERHRISRELHDGLAQELIAVKMTLENMISRREYLNEKRLYDLIQQVNNSLDELKKISTDLAPSGILEFGFEMAIKNLCNQVKRSSGVGVDFSWFGDFENIKQRTKIYLYRIVQEALNNAVKHSGASKILVQLTETSENLVLIIEDNGRGFYYNANDMGLGKGLFNMRERSILLNGTFDIETSPDEGTTIRVKVNKIV
jgi:signal transduction histidine kinase